MSLRPAPGAIVLVGRAFPGQGDQSFPGTLNTRTRRNVRVAAAAGITEAIQLGQDIDPPMPALNLRAPWRRASDAVPVTVTSGGELPGGIPTKKRGRPDGR